MKLGTRARRAALVLSLALAPALAAAGEGEPRPAPECALRALPDGQPYRLKATPGKVMWVDFWASWCGPCAEAFPFLDALERELHERGFQVVGVNLDERRSDAEAFLERHPASFALAVDDTGACPAAFGVEGMPSAYLIDRLGRIRSVHMGFREGQEAVLRSRVLKLLAEGEAEGKADASSAGPPEPPSAVEAP